LDSRDNSVLKSLKELRKQEEERVKKERAEAEARADAERARREEEERLRRIEQEKHAQEREGRLRLEESERRARIEAETKLQQERMRLEAQAKVAAKEKGVPVGMIVGVVAVVLVIAGGIIYKIKSDHEREAAALQVEKEEAIKKEKLRLAEQEKRFEQMEASLKKQIAEAKSDAERAAYQKQLEDATRARHASGGGRAAAPREKKEAPPVAAPELIKKKKAVSLDPLEGLKL
jgi:DNA repair exonuclease SbcCD ATPase subunit